MQQWLKENSTPRSVVIERMRDTAAARDIFIFDEKHTVTEILDAWPRLLDAEIVNIQSFILMLNTIILREREREREREKEREIYCTHTHTHIQNRYFNYFLDRCRICAAIFTTTRRCSL